MGVADNTKAATVALVATVVQFLAMPSLFLVVFDSLVAYTARYIAWKFRLHGLSSWKSYM